MAKTVDTARLNIEAIDFDNEHEVEGFHEAWIDTGQACVRDGLQRLRQMGLVDAHGNQVKTLVPTDMLDADSDFGG